MTGSTIDDRTDYDVRGSVHRTAGWLRRMSRRPAVWLGIALGVLDLASMGPFDPTGPQSWILPSLALGYLVLGAARGRLRRPGVLWLQMFGLFIFTGVAVAGLMVDPTVGRYIVAAGWLGHAVWDLAHRDGRVVPRWYVEFCAPFDILIALSLVLAPTL